MGAEFKRYRVQRVLNFVGAEFNQRVLSSIGAEFKGCRVVQHSLKIPAYRKFTSHYLPIERTIIKS